VEVLCLDELDIENLPPKHGQGTLHPHSLLYHPDIYNKENIKELWTKKLLQVVPLIGCTFESNFDNFKIRTANSLFARSAAKVDELILFLL